MMSLVVSRNDSVCESEGATVKQLTLRGFEADLEEALTTLVRSERISLNRAAIRLMRRGAGLEGDRIASDVIGSSLDEFVGSWTETQAEEFDAAVSVFEKVDEELWK